MSTAITDKHPEYTNNQARWELYLRSYMGGEDYHSGNYLTRYVNESNEEYTRRLGLTPMDNHCRNIVHIYSSFLWRLPPVRAFNSLAKNPALQQFLSDADLDGRSFNAFMKEAQQWASVYGHVWVMVDKPASNAGTRAEELAQGLRPYVTLITPENVYDWNYSRLPSGRYALDYLKVRESVDRKSDSEKVETFRIWTPETVSVYEVSGESEKLLEQVDNPLGIIPAVFVPAARGVVRGIGISDVADIAYMQKAIYQELSEIEQLIRISNHPTLVKTHETDASAGAGAIINLPDDMDGNLKPYQLQPSGQNLDAVRAAINDKIEMINRMAHMGAVRGTEAVTQSGVAMQTEFQLLSARLAEKADLLQLAEEQIWRLFCEWLNITPDVEVYYPDSFNVRDYDAELMFLQKAKASGVKSETLMKAIDKQIADLVLDDEELAKSHTEIDASTISIGVFEG